MNYLKLKGCYCFPIKLMIIMKRNCRKGDLSKHCWWNSIKYQICVGEMCALAKSLFAAENLRQWLGRCPWRGPEMKSRFGFSFSFVNIRPGLVVRCCSCIYNIKGPHINLILGGLKCFPGYFSSLFSCPGQLNNWHCLSVGPLEPTNNQSRGSIKEWP